MQASPADDSVHAGNPSILIMKIDQTIKTFSGNLLKVTHDSTTLGCSMRFNLFLPASPTSNVPLLFYLAGLTCTPDNGAEKGFLTAEAAKKGLAVVFPDTSPRGLNIPGDDAAYDFGTGAGFYLNATKEPWSKNYHMEDYIVTELYDLLFKEFPQLNKDKVGITGHSMGGHGSLTLFMRHPDKFKSVSAFAPICNPSKCPWGEKAFSGYLGPDTDNQWAAHDATDLVTQYKGPTPEILIDVGTSDQFYKDGQLLPENFIKAAETSPYAGKVKLRFQDGYDHLYYFVSTFAADHVDHAAKYLA